ncbi:AraC family transcriptional regulator [Paenibacillus thermotolerans]|uniref:AraC family transcriptional regulator n=1 Tax=Paenibacillus thermotolerans TaxID=3027807 RepID=UPI0023678DF8|nr:MULTISPECIES: AraC family transcriptional regulator [unclassified Paenibacillus]
MWRETVEIAMNGSPGDGEIVVLFSGQERTLPLHHVGPQVLDYYLVHYVLSGKGWCRSADGMQPLAAGDTFFIFQDALSEYCSDEREPWQYCWVAFRGPMAAKWMDRLGVSTDRPIIHGNGKPNKKIASLIYAVYLSLSSEIGAAADVRSGGYLRLLMAEWLRLKPPVPEPMRKWSDAEIQVERAVQWFSLQYSQQKSISQLAKDLGYHRTYFSKLFRNAVGMSPQQFLLQVRMERAKELLHQPLTVEHIAASIGFSDPLYFSKQFKRRFGLSPTEYRQRSINMQKNVEN